MLAAKLTEKETVELDRVETPQPEAGEVLLAIKLCGICGTDLHRWHGKWDGGAFGHEFCAVAEEVGPRVSGLQEGDRVAGECFGYCGRCEACQEGNYNHCAEINWNPGRPAGAMAEKMTYPVASLVRVPKSLNDREVALIEPLAVACRVVSRGGLGPGDTVAIVGAGTIGLLCVAVADEMGAGRIFSIARHAHQADLAVRMGASEVCTPDDGDPREFIGKATDGQGVDLSIDSVASGTSFSTALAFPHPRGRVVEAGGVTRPLLAALGPLVNGELTVTGSSCYATTDSKRDIERAAELLADGGLTVEELVTHTYPLSEAQKAFQTADDKETGSVKVMLEC